MGPMGAGLVPTAETFCKSHVNVPISQPTWPGTVTFVCSDALRDFLSSALALCSVSSSLPGSLWDPTAFTLHLTEAEGCRQLPGPSGEQ